MERLAQYLDDLEDLFYAVAMLAERIRHVVRFVLFISTAVSIQALGVLLALTNPPIAVAAASLLLVGMLYHGAVQKKPLPAGVS
jgi:hypothetical protein